MFKNNAFLRNMLLALFCIALAGVLVASAGWYPIAIASGRPILASSFQTAYDLSYTYYSYVLQGEQSGDGDIELRTRLRQVVLEGLIDAKLVDNRLRMEMSAADIRDKVEERVQVVWSNEESKKALAEMTRASEGDIKKYFLEQEAKNQILDELLRQEGSDLTTWLADAHKTAQVTEFVSDLEWTTDGIAVVGAQ